MEETKIMTNDTLTAANRQLRERVKELEQQCEHWKGLCKTWQDKYNRIHHDPDYEHCCDLRKKAEQRLAEVEASREEWRQNALRLSREKAELEAAIPRDAVHLGDTLGETLRRYLAEVERELRDEQEALANVNKSRADEIAWMSWADETIDALQRENQELVGKRDADWRQFIRLSRDEQIKTLRDKWDAAERETQAVMQALGVSQYDSRPVVAYVQELKEQLRLSIADQAHTEAERNDLQRENQELKAKQHTCGEIDDMYDDLKRETKTLREALEKVRPEIHCMSKQLEGAGYREGVSVKEAKAAIEQALQARPAGEVAK